MTSDWSVYILRCCDDSLYVGISNNVDRRVKRHNEGDGAAYTRSHRPVVLIWTEVAESESAARKREAQIKGWTRLKKENLIAYGHPNGLVPVPHVKKYRDN
jgi:putative endonuclease